MPALTRFVAQLLRERDAISRTLKDDLADKQLQLKLRYWRQGRTEGWPPVGATAQLLSKLNPRKGFSIADRLYSETIAEAKADGSAGHLLPKLAEAHKAHRRLLLEAVRTYQKSSASIPSLGGHLRACADLLPYAGNLTASDNAQDDNTPSTSDSSAPDDLPERHIEILEAMRELKASSKKKRKTAPDIARQAIGEADSGKVKAPLAELVQWGFVGSMQGRNGGSWLTPDGRKKLTIEKRKR